MEGMQQSSGSNCSNCHAGKFCGCGHHKVMPALVLLIGVLFLLKALNAVSTGFVDTAWPILLILAMGMKLMSGKCKCYNK